MDLSTYKELLAFGVFIVWPLLIAVFFIGIFAFLAILFQG